MLHIIVVIDMSAVLHSKHFRYVHIIRLFNKIVMKRQDALCGI